MNETGSFYFNPQGKGAGVFLGPTESRVMEICWQNQNLTVKKVIFYLSNKKTPAYTTIMTVLENLTAKGLLKKSRENRLSVYNPAIDRKSFLKERIGVVERCLKTNIGKI